MSCEQKLNVLQELADGGCKMANRDLAEFTAARKQYDEEMVRKVSGVKPDLRIEAFTNAINNFASALIANLPPMIKILSEFSQNLMVEIDKEYDKARRPYGPADDDMMRWFKDVCSDYKREDDRQKFEAAYKRLI